MFVKGEQFMYSRFEHLLQKNNVTAYRVAKETGIAQTTFSDWKKGKSSPKFEKLSKIADYFGVPIEYFTGEEQTAPEEREPSENEELFRIFSSLPEDQQKSIADLIRSLSKGL